MNRYDTVRKILDKGIVRVGTANLPNHEDSNSDISVSYTHLTLPTKRIV